MVGQVQRCQFKQSVSGSACIPWLRTTRPQLRWVLGPTRGSGNNIHNGFGTIICTFTFYETSALVSAKPDEGEASCFCAPYLDAVTNALGKWVVPFYLQYVHLEKAPRLGFKAAPLLLSGHLADTSSPRRSRRNPGLGPKCRCTSSHSRLVADIIYV